MLRLKPEDGQKWTSVIDADAGFWLGMHPTAMELSVIELRDVCLKVEHHGTARPRGQYDACLGRLGSACTLLHCPPPLLHARRDCEEAHVHAPCR